MLAIRVVLPYLRTRHRQVRTSLATCGGGRIRYIRPNQRKDLHRHQRGGFAYQSIPSPSCCAVPITPNFQSENRPSRNRLPSRKDQQHEHHTHLVCFVSYPGIKPGGFPPGRDLPSCEDRPREYSTPSVCDPPYPTLTPEPLIWTSPALLRRPTTRTSHSLCSPRILPWHQTRRPSTWALPVLLRRPTTRILDSLGLRSALSNSRTRVLEPDATCPLVKTCGK